MLYDFLDPDGKYSGHTNLYAAWEVSGVIGDANGDGNPDIGGRTPCSGVMSDQPGIDKFDDYDVEFYECAYDPSTLFAIIEISANSIKITDQFGNPVPIPAGVQLAMSPIPSFSLRTHVLKLCVTNLESLLNAVLAAQ